MSRCMLLAAVLFDLHRTAPRLTITRPDRHTVWIDEAQDVTPALIARVLRAGAL